jgi:serine/threonine protein kinase
MYSFCGSPIYIAPETLAKKAYDHKVDYYALGTLLYEMYTGSPPFNFKKANLIKEAKLTQDVEYPKDMDPGVKELLICLLHKNPDKRIADYEFYKEKLRELGVDMEIIEKNRYHYKAKIGHDFERTRPAMEAVQEHSYYVSDHEVAQKMINLDQIFYFRKDEENRPVDARVVNMQKRPKEPEMDVFDRDKKLEDNYQTNTGEEVTDLGSIDMLSVQTFTSKRVLDLSRTDNFSSNSKYGQLDFSSKSSSKRKIF